MFCHCVYDRGRWVRVTGDSFQLLNLTSHRRCLCEESVPELGLAHFVPAEVPHHSGGDIHHVRDCLLLPGRGVQCFPLWSSHLSLSARHCKRSTSLKNSCQNVKTWRSSVRFWGMELKETSRMFLYQNLCQLVLPGVQNLILIHWSQLNTCRDWSHYNWR